MKRKFWLVMVITVTTVARAYDFGFQAENGKNLFFNYLGGDSVAIVKGSSNYSGQIIVPETVLDSVGDTYRVTSVGANAFYNSLNITYLSLPTSINHIGNNAFCSAIFTEAGYYNWRPIAVLDLPNLKTIENYAFAQASMIRALYAPNVTYIGAYAFRDAYNLRHCVLSDNVQIGAETFNSAMYLSEFDIPKSQVTIAKQTFSACWLLKRLGIPEGVKYIRAKAFSACMSLESLVFPESVDSIGSQVIYGNDWQHAMGAWGLICEDSIDFALTTGCRYAQYNTSNRLKSLYFKGTTPPRLAPDAFVNVIKSNVTCYVPAEAKKEYESASDSLYYKSFINTCAFEIIELEKLLFKILT